MLRNKVECWIAFLIVGGFLFVLGYVGDGSWKAAEAAGAFTSALNLAQLYIGLTRFYDCLHGPFKIGISHQGMIIHTGDSSTGWKGEVENQD